MDRWRLARDIRSFVGEVRQATPNGPGDSHASRLQERLNWALAYADKVDPGEDYATIPEVEQEEEDRD